ncbi:hypothetical protein [Micromonospora sp. NPDC000668]|uniref:hypothetical protein n=1 Tax=Micromonospora sp. NPDC000668 TaxID=3364219 RepID=UPI0036912D98
MGLEAHTTLAQRGRRALAGVLILLCCLLTAGCSPAQISVTAVFLDDGHPTALFHPCGRSDVVVVSTVEKMTGSAPATGLPLGWSVADAKGDDPVTQIRLLETPPGWKLRITEPGGEVRFKNVEPGARLLTAFAEDQHYGVWADTDGAESRDAVVRFTLGDLRSLADGEVWAVPDPFGEPLAMTGEEFRQYAAASC